MCRDQYIGIAADRYSGVHLGTRSSKTLHGFMKRGYKPSPAQEGLRRLSMNHKNRLSSIDAYLGKQIRNIRIEHGISQAELGNALGVTYQKIQKYEHGINRISARQLYYLALKFETTLESFFEDLPKTEPDQTAISKILTK